MLADDPALRSRLQVHVIGAPSGSGLEAPRQLEQLAAQLGITDLVRFLPPQHAERLAQHYRAADVAVVPSHNESFGLVALEAQACGTPVVAASVGGLRTAVADGASGVLVPSHDPREWALRLEELLDDPARRARLAQAAVRHAAGFGWEATAEATARVYREVLAARRR
jgi:D-inositol-3-phosphate glycosyltransferase